MATGFSAWGGIFFLNGRWHAVGGGKDLPPHLLAVGERTVCMAKADDWLNDHESADSAHKTRRWLNEPPTGEATAATCPEQLRADFGMTRYQASACLAFQFNKSSIQRLVSRPTTAIGRRREMRDLLPTRPRGMAGSTPGSSRATRTLLRPVGLLLTPLPGVVLPN
jgi:hypothetical protein